MQESNEDCPGVCLDQKIKFKIDYEDLPWCECAKKNKDAENCHLAFLDFSGCPGRPFVSLSLSLATSTPPFKASQLVCRRCLCLHIFKIVGTSLNLWRSFVVSWTFELFAIHLFKYMQCWSAPHQPFINSISAPHHLHFSSTSAPHQLHISSSSALHQLHISSKSTPNQLQISSTSLEQIT